MQSYEIKSPPWTLLWFRILGNFSVENMGWVFLCFKLQTIVSSALIHSTLLSSWLGASLKHKNTQPLYIFNIEIPQNSEPQNGPKRGLDFIALLLCLHLLLDMPIMYASVRSKLFGTLSWEVFTINELKLYSLWSHIHISP